MNPRILTATIAALLLPGALQAADRFWIDSFGGSFNSASNWSATDGGAGGASVPGATDIANFTLNDTYTVSFTAGATNTNLDVENGNVSFDLAGFTYTLTSPSGISIGNAAGQTGRLTVKDGTLGMDTNGDSVYLGLSSSGTGFLTISTDGELGTALLRPNVYVGLNGIGTLTVNDNGRIDGGILSLGVNNSSTTGTVAITGPNAVADFSENTSIGANGAGTLSVTNGGTLTSAATGVLGSVRGSDGTATVSGAGSSWTVASTTTIGSSGDGTLTISAGGLVSSGNNATLGSGSTGFGTATVTGANSRWNISGTQTIGAGGLGVMTVSSGGQVVSSGAGNLGVNPAAEGRVTVTGAGSRWTLGSSLVGSFGMGDLTVSAGGEVSASSVILGSVASGIGVATVAGAGSKLTTSGDVTVASLGTGTLNVASGGEVNTGADLTINDPVGAPIGTLNLDGGSIFVTGNFTNNSVFNFTDGLLRVTGNFQPSALPASLVLGSADNGGLTTLDLIGTGTTTNIVDLNVGSVGRAQLLLRQGRVLNVGANFTGIGALVGGEGTVSVQSGAQLLSTGTVDVGGSGVTPGGAGTLDIAGGTADVGTLRIYAPGIVHLSSGTLAFNSAPTLDGQLNWTGGTLRFDAAFSLTSANVPKLLGLDGTLNAGQTLASALGVNVTLDTPVIVDGGTLSVGNALNNNSTLEIRSGSASVAGTITNAAGARLFVERDLSIGTALGNLSGGRIELVDGTGRLTGAGSIANSGLVTGDGTITNTFNNNAGGEVRGEFGKTLFFTGATGANAGRVNLLGGTVSFAQQFTNSASGQINGQGALYFPTSPVPSSASPNAGLMNAGNINLTGGDSQIFGTVQMQAGSRLIVSGGATASFFDVFRHSGIEVRASAGSNIVFFGDVRGAGSFTGTGTIYFEGGYSPGNSPAAVSFEGDLFFGDASSLTLEIGGVVSGAEYDHLNIGGALYADGDLVLALLGGYEPQLGDTFDLFDASTFAGDFDSISTPALSGGNAWDFSALKSTGSVTVVPEPGVATLLLASLGLLGLRRRQ